MTNKQCIEVAEKIWGYRHIKDGAGKDWGMYGEPQAYLIKTDADGFDEILMPDLESIVLSWQGFGRTVEAMSRHDRVAVKNFSQPYTDYLRSRISLDELIEATHLAALEALDENTNIS